MIARWLDHGLWITPRGAAFTGRDLVVAVAIVIVGTGCLSLLAWVALGPLERP